MPKYRAIASTEDINSYGFGLKTDGIDIDSRYKDNGQILKNHNYDFPIGYGYAYKIDKDLYVDFDLDEDDSVAVTWAKKIEKGHIKTLSIGISYDEQDFDYIDGVPYLTKSVLMEVSLTPVPANKSAVMLNSNGYLEFENKKGILYLNAEINKNEKNDKKMKILKELNYKTEDDLITAFNEKDETIKTLNNDIESLKNTKKDLNAKIKELNEKIGNLDEKEKTIKNLNSELKNKKEIISDLTSEVKELNAKIAKYVKNEIENYIDEAINTGKVNMNQKDFLLKLSEKDFDLVKGLIDSADSVEKPNFDLNVNKEEDRTNWSYLDWAEKDSDGLLNMKKTNKELYDKLYKNKNK